MREKTASLTKSWKLTEDNGWKRIECSDDTREAKGDRMSACYVSLLSGDYEGEEADVPPYEAYDAWTLAREIEYLSSNTRDALFGLPNCRDIFRYYSAEEAHEIMKKYRSEE